MKKYLALACVMGCIAQPAFAANKINLTNFTGAAAQADFKKFSEDLGSALSYKAVTPAEPLGITGFDLGVEVSSTEAKSMATATGNSSVKSLIVPKLHVYKGLPLGIDVAAFYSAVPTTNITLIGGELRYAILEGGMAMPAIAVRGAMTRLSGVDKFSFNTKSLDVSISKGFAMLTPYAGVGRVWTDSAPDSTIPGLKKESFQQAKTFVGANLNFGLMNFAAEYDKTGAAASTSIKFGFRF
ncbi:MAG: hypothetical protein HY938_09965 [Nitrosomonadales bacterium]|nr:hypothetical protein [Nitrosomonadales bacterium]